MRSPKKPTAQKKLQGTERKCRANPKEPKYTAELPPPPPWLSKEAREVWAYYGAEMNGQRTMAKAYSAVLAAFAESVAEFADLTARMARGERFLLDEEGHAKKYPIAKERRECMQRMQSLAADLGLSPASAGKVASIGDPPEADPLEKLNARRAERERARQQAAAPPN